MIIDIHTHIGRFYLGRPHLTADRLVRQMDEWGIDKSVVLPIENPEETDFFVTTREVIRACRRFEDRLIPFCNIDPRRRYPGRFDPRPILKEYIEEGCRGFGENLAGIPVDDPMNQVIYQACGEFGLPIVMHFDSWINRDKRGMRHFERMLKKFPDTIFIAHGPSWWREISKGERSKESYPKGKVRPGGRVEKLLEAYPNLYADLSAGSGYNAITRDPSFGPGFLERFAHKLLFGTDFLSPVQKVPIVEFMKSVEISKSAKEKIMFRNALKLLKL